MGGGLWDQILGVRMVQYYLISLFIKSWIPTMPRNGLKSLCWNVARAMWWDVAGAMWCLKPISVQLKLSLSPG